MSWISHDNKQYTDSKIFLPPGGGKVIIHPPSFFPRKRVSLTTFMNEGELEFLEGIKKCFHYFIILLL